MKVTDKAVGYTTIFIWQNLFMAWAAAFAPPNTLPAKKWIIIYKTFYVLYTQKTQWVSNLQVSLAEFVGGPKGPRGVGKLTSAGDLSYYKLSSWYTIAMLSFSDLVWVIQDVANKRFFTLYTAARAHGVCPSPHLPSWLVSLVLSRWGILRLSFWYFAMFLSRTYVLLLPGGTPWTTSEAVSRQTSWQTRPKHHILCLELFLYFLGDLQGMSDRVRRSREKSSEVEESLENLPQILEEYNICFSLSFFLIAISLSFWLSPLLLFHLFLSSW